MAAVKTFTGTDMEKVYNAITASVRVKARFISSHMGGQPSSENGVRAFVQFHLGKTNSALDPKSPDYDETEVETVVKRIMDEEVREEVDTTPEGGEVQEKESYQVNVIRRNENGPYLAAHMVKACLKQAASRFGTFQKKRGSKGDLAEVGEVRAFGKSLDDDGSPYHILFLDEKGKPLGPDYTRTFEKVMGRVNTPQGAKSIVTDVEVLPEGTQFEFELRFPPTKISEEDVLGMIAFGAKCGLGSARSLEHGKWEIISMEIEFPKDPKDKRTDKEKKEKKTKKKK